MNLFERYFVNLRFDMPTDAPREKKDKWKELLGNLYSRNNEYIVKKWLSYCIIESNSNLDNFKDTKRGIGVSKKLIFDTSSEYAKEDESIFIHVSNTETDKWTLEEIEDLLEAFVKCCNDITSCKCVVGCIEMENLD